jgi:hypothetical protein
MIPCTIGVEREGRAPCAGTVQHGTLIGSVRRAKAWMDGTCMERLGGLGDNQNDVPIYRASPRDVYAASRTRTREHGLSPCTVALSQRAGHSQNQASGPGWQRGPGGTTPLARAAYTGVLVDNPGGTLGYSAAPPISYGITPIFGTA